MLAGVFFLLRYKTIIFTITFIIINNSIIRITNRFISNNSITKWN